MQRSDNRYLVIDGGLGGTGIRDPYETGFLDPTSLGLSNGLIDRLSGWVAKYEAQHYAGFGDTEAVERLDQEGLAIAAQVRAELPAVKVRYYSDARMSYD